MFLKEANIPIQTRLVFPAGMMHLQSLLNLGQQLVTGLTIIYENIRLLFYSNSNPFDVSTQKHQLINHFFG